MSWIRRILDRPRDRGLRPFYTVLILPHSRSRFRKLHVSRAFLLSVAAVGLLLLGAGLSAPHLLFRFQTQGVKVDQLVDENRRLREDRDRFELALADVSSQLGEFETQARRLADELGVEQPSPRAAGGSAVVGSSRASVIDEQFAAVGNRAGDLQESLGQLDRLFEQRVRKLAAVPSSMPVDGWFSHGFGWRKDPFTGARQFHRGIDIVADLGTPIQAPADGIVSRATQVSDLGKTIDLSHGHGFVTRYAHLNELLVRPGQRVKRGELIGRLGSTGRSTGPHLHYEVFRDGRRVNPWKYLDQPGR